jgi:hypothetical protein
MVLPPLKKIITLRLQGKDIFLLPLIITPISINLTPV